MEASPKNLAKQHVIINVYCHQLLKVHQMVEWIARPIVHSKFRHQKTARWLIANNMGGQPKWRTCHPTIDLWIRIRPSLLGHLPMVALYVMADSQVTPHCQLGSVGLSRHLICALMSTFFDPRASSELSKCQTDGNPFLSPFPFLSYKTCCLIWLSLIS